MWENSIKNPGGPWDSICNIWRTNKDVQHVGKKELWMLVGDRSRTLFWEN